MALLRKALFWLTQKEEINTATAYIDSTLMPRAVEIHSELTI